MEKFVDHAAGLKPGERNVLRALLFLEAAGTPPRVREIAHTLGYEVSGRVTHWIGSLEKMGLAGRVKGRGKSVAVVLTPRGREAATSLAQMARAVIPDDGKKLREMTWPHRDDPGGRMSDQMSLDVGRGPPEGNVIRPHKFNGAVFTNAPERRENDFYPTPPEGTEAFLRAERPYLSRFKTIWEPCVGDGAIARVLEAHGFEVFGSDIADRGYPLTCVRDFREFRIPATDAAITNPPYHEDLPERFVRHALSIGMKYVAMLLKQDYWNADGRVRFYREIMPARIYPLAFRLDFLGQGRPTMNCQWVVWEFGTPVTQCVHELPLQRPKGAIGQEGFLS